MYLLERLKLNRLTSSCREDGVNWLYRLSHWVQLKNLTKCMDEKIKQQQADWQRPGTKLSVNHFLFLWYLLVCPPESLKPTRGHCVARRRKDPRRLKGRERILLTLRKCAEIPPFLSFSPFLTSVTQNIHCWWWHWQWQQWEPART